VIAARHLAIFAAGTLAIASYLVTLLGVEFGWWRP